MSSQPDARTLRERAEHIARGRICSDASEFICGGSDMPMCPHCFRFAIYIERELQAVSDAATAAERARLLPVLQAAAQFLQPDIDRGPAVNGWQNTVKWVAEALEREP